MRDLYKEEDLAKSDTPKQKIPCGLADFGCTFVSFDREDMLEHLESHYHKKSARRVQPNERQRVLAESRKVERERVTKPMPPEKSPKSVLNGHSSLTTLTNSETSQAQDSEAVERDSSDSREPPAPVSYKKLWEEMKEQKRKDVGYF